MALNYQLQQPKLYFAHTGITSRSDPFASVSSQFNMPSLLETAPMGPQATGFQGEAYRLPDTAVPVAQAPSDSSLKATIGQGLQGASLGMAVGHAVGAAYPASLGGKPDK